MKRGLASYIDHTLLAPAASAAQIDQLCQEAREHGFYAVCINPYWVCRAKQTLEGSAVRVATVIGFPLGATCTESKVFEAEKAVEDGADELDMVLNIGALKSGADEVVRHDISAVVAVAGTRPVKVIIETCLLTEEEKIRACRLSEAAGARFVKTSTGFSSGGATIEDVALMRRTVSAAVSVKASGGVRTYEAANAMIQAGADRIGTSNGVAIVTGGKGR